MVFNLKHPAIMSNLVRAFLLSAAATGLAALVVTKIQQRGSLLEGVETPPDDFEVDAEALGEDAVQQLTDELDTML